MIAIDPDTPTTPEEQGNEFGYAIFEEFPKVQTKTYEVNEVIVGTNKENIKNDPELQKSLQCIENPIAPQRLKKLQQQDTNIETLKHKLQHNRLDKEYYSLDENELLMRKVIDRGHKFCAIYLPSELTFQVLRTAHDDLGHNGFPRTYASPQMSLLLERNEGRHQKTLQNMCNMPATQTREREIRKKNIQTITSTHGFYLHGLNRQIPPPDKSWTPLCIDSCLYVYRVYMVCTFEDKNSGRGRESIYGPHLQ